MSLTVAASTQSRSLNIPSPDESSDSLVSIVREGFSDFHRELFDSQSLLRQSYFWRKSASDFASVVSQPIQNIHSFKSFSLQFLSGAAVGRLSAFLTQSITRGAVSESLALKSLEAYGSRQPKTLLLTLGLGFFLHAATQSTTNRLLSGEALDKDWAREVASSTFGFALTHAFNLVLTKFLPAPLNYIAPIVLGGFVLSASSALSSEFFNQLGFKHQNVGSHFDNVASHSVFHGGSFIFGAAWRQSRGYAERLLRRSEVPFTDHGDHIRLPNELAAPIRNKTSRALAFLSRGELQEASQALQEARLSPADATIFLRLARHPKLADKRYIRVLIDENPKTGTQFFVMVFGPRQGTKVHRHVDAEGRPLRALERPLTSQHLVETRFRQLPDGTWVEDGHITQNYQSDIMVVEADLGVVHALYNPGPQPVASAHLYEGRIDMVKSLVPLDPPNPGGSR